MMRSPGYLKILPLLVLVALLSLAIRLGEFSEQLARSGSALAQEEVQAQTPPLPAQTEPDKSDQPPGPGTTVQPPALESPNMAQGEAIQWQDAGDTAFEFSEVQESLHRDLSSRRKMLDQLEKELSMREALLAVGEKELEQKLRELSAIRAEIKELLEQQSEEEAARINSLVRIYEGMRAKDAAAIFNTLDMDILIEIMARMAERRSAPILAEMHPERARAVTTLLAEQKKLPSLAGY